jgi:hypothetical protein
MHELGAVKNHMLPQSVDGNERCYCRLMLKFQKGRVVD